MFEEKVCKEKNWGSPCLFLKYAKKKAISKASCYVSVAIVTDSVVLKITEFKIRNFKYAKSESVKLPEAQIFENCIEPP